ncbi:MAG: Pvc16 family protein [Pseudomonadota bacterium]
MADLGAVHLVGQSIVALLNQRRTLLAQEGKLGSVPATQDIALVPVAKLVSGSPPSSGLGLTCFAINRSDHVQQVATTGSTRENIGISLELSYLLASWSSTSSDETALLSWAMLELNRYSSLGVGQLVGPGWSRDESIQIAPGDETTEQIFRLWDGFKLKYRLSSTFRARVVRIGYGASEDSLPVAASRFSFANSDVEMEPTS